MNWKKLELLDYIHSQAGEIVPTSYTFRGVNAICPYRCVGRICQCVIWVWHGAWLIADPQPMSAAVSPRSDYRWQEGVGAQKEWCYLFDGVSRKFSLIVSIVLG